MGDLIYAEFVGPRPKRNPRNKVIRFLNKHQKKQLGSLLALFFIITVACTIWTSSLLYGALVSMVLSVGVVAIVMAAIIWVEKVSPDSWDQ